jgi:hypothetical protein
MCQEKREITSPWGETFKADVCMIPVLEWIWKGGFRTSEHCCGHGKVGYSCVIFDVFGENEETLKVNRNGWTND